MEFKVKRKDIIKPLQNVVSAIARKEAMPILGMLSITSVDGETLRLAGTDLELEIKATVPAEVIEPGIGTLPGWKFFELVKNWKDDAEFSVKIDQERAVIRRGRARYTLHSIQEREFPHIEYGEVKACGKLNISNLRRSLNIAFTATSQQDVRFFLQGVLFHWQEGGLRLVGTDGHRLALAEMGSDVDKEMKVILPRKGVMEVMKVAEFAGEEVEVSVSENYMSFDYQSITILSKLVDGVYPEYDKVLPWENPYSIVLDREDFKQILSGVMVLRSKSDPAVRMDLEPEGVLRLSAANNDQEEGEEEMSVVWGGSPLTIGFNGFYLMDALSQLETERVEMTLRDGGSSVMVREEGQEDPFFVIMPMRL